MRDTRDVVRRILLAEGALVEVTEPQALDVIATPRLQEVLAIPEAASLAFDAEGPEGATRVSLESDWFDRLDGLMGDRGRCFSLTDWSSRHSSRPHDPEEILAKHCVLGNATYRFAGAEPQWTRYLLLVFRTIAVSDEKREDLLTVCVNESNGALADHLVEPLLAELEDHGEHFAFLQSKEEMSTPWTAQEAQRWCARVLPARVRARLQPFLSGMERRMVKDADQLHAYHAALRKEARSKIEEAGKRAVGDDSLIRHQELRISSIEREYHAKIADLRRKYAMAVEVRLAQALRVAMPVHRIRGVLMRRKGKRPLHLDWSPLSKRPDVLLCEGCSSVAAAHVLCDDRLHILCPACLAACAGCGVEYCRACHAGKCPRCGPSMSAKQAEA